jgi:hypothetical protein
MFECVIPLPDALIRKPMDEPSKSYKHADHDQSDHGNWATGGSNSEYRGSHQAPGRNNGAPLSDLLAIYPDDVYEKGIEYYGHYGDRNNPIEKEAWSTVARMRGNPDAQIQIYRAVPTDAPSEINSGDWVTIVRDYAKEHGEGPLMGNYQIVETTARAGDLFTAGDSIMEWGWQPATKSLKHGDHDQSDHGNWADGSGDGSKGNPIRTNSVEEAARALGEGKHVELRTPDQVAVLLDRLNGLAKEAEAAGSKAKNIDLCQLTVPGTNLFCVESKGIPRVEMPQLKGIPNSGSAASDLPADKRGEVDITEAYLERLRSSGVTLTEDEALASHLKATQNELNGGKVAGIMQAARAGELDLNQPIVVSKDGYIVDGHHRWAAKVALEHDGIDDPETDMKIPVVRVDQDILEILESSKQFAADMGLPQVAVKSIKHGDHDQSDHGIWARSGVNHEYTGKPRSAASRAGMNEHTDRYGDPERRESGRRSGSRNLGREVTYMEIVALESYKGGGYGEINRFLRGTQEGDDWTKDRIDAVKSLALPTTEPMTVTRMMPLFAVEGIAAGQIYEDKGFMSTGKGDRPAQFFHGYPVQMQIEVPAGTPVVDFDNFTGLDGWGNIEREVTLMPNTQLVIDRVEQRDWNRDFGPTETDGLKIYARLVPPTKSVKHADHDQSEHGNWASANTEKSGPQAWLGINALSDVPKYKIGSPSEASEPQVAARIAENISQFKAAGGVVTRLPILPNAGVTGSYSYVETPEQEATSNWLFREAESARASADEYELRAQDASSQEEQDKLLSIASGYSHMATALDRASGSGTFIATTGGERGTIVGVLAGSFNSGEWEGTMFGSSQSVAGTGSALMYAAIEAVADADRVSRLAITFPEPESLPFYRAFGFTPESGTWENKPNPSGVILSRGSAVRIDEAVSGMTPASIVAQYGLTKSIKHGDHDQSDHGNWAHGSAPRPTLSAEDKSKAEEALLKNNGGWKGGNYQHAFKLTDLEVAAATHYKGFGYMEMNNLLRGVGSDWGMAFVPEVVRGAELLESAMEKTSLQTDIKLYRGMHIPSDDAEKFLSTLKPGAVYTDPAFVSTSKSEKVASGFALDRAPDDRAEDRTSIIWEMFAPAGTSAMDFDKLFTSTGATEKEVLLASDTHLRILGTQREGFTSHGEPIIRVTATVIPTGTPPVKHADHDQSEHGNWADGSVPLAKTPIEQVDALRSWSSNSYNMINGALRNPDTLGSQERGGLREPVQKMQDQLDKLFAGVPKTTEEMTVFRGATGDWVKDLVDRYEATIDKMRAGYRETGEVQQFIRDRFTDLGFTSTTPDRDIAIRFSGTDASSGGVYTGEGRAIFEINIPEGSSVVNVEEFVNEFGGFTKFAAEEKEYLLPRGSTFEVADVTPSEEQFGSQGPLYYTIRLDLVPSSTKSLKHADHDQSDHGSWATGESAETKFSEDENGAITIYTDQGHMSINGYLRGSRYGGDDQYVPKWVANLDSAIESAGPTTRNMTIYRGISQRHLQELIDGGVLQDAGFASFTKDGETAAGFATGGSMGMRRSDGAVLELDLPAGSAALDMKDAGIPNEQEVLLPRGSRFELISGPEELDLSNEEDNENNRLPVYQIRLVSPTKSLKHGDHDQSDHGNWARGFDSPSTSVPSPANSKTTVPLWWHERDQTVSLDNMRNGMEASVREALDAYTHWSADDGYETGTRLAFHAALNEQLRAGVPRFKAVEAVARLFAEADDEELVAKLGRGFMDIDNALRDSKVKEDMMVTRASSPIMSIQELEAAAKGESINIYGQEIAPGAVYSDAGIISTSADMTYQSTQFFAQNWDSPEGLEDWQIPTTVRWNINLPSGAPALDLRALGFASQHGEDEVLLPRNTHFRIDGVDVQLPPMNGGSAKVTVSATVIPTHSTTKP